jgi:hypothetical protein
METGVSISARDGPDEWKQAERGSRQNERVACRRTALTRNSSALVLSYYVILRKVQ